MVADLGEDISVGSEEGTMNLLASYLYQLVWRCAACDPKIPELVPV